jgi:hypothetical protein
VDAAHRGNAYGLANAVKTHSPLFYLHVRLNPGARFGLPQGHSERAIVLPGGNIVPDIEANVSQSMSHGSNASYYSSPALVLALQPSGEIAWHKTLYKYQVQPLNSDLLGHVLLTSNNTLYMMYNDNLENFTFPADIDRKMNGLLKNSTYVATVAIDEKGVAKKQYHITKSPKDESHFFPAELRTIAPDFYHLTFHTSKGSMYATLKTSP